MAKISAIIGQDVHKITSSQVIVDLITCVKELVDNSIDAEAHHIEVTFKNYGMDSIECSDDGDGISSENFETLALKHHTSKIRSFQDVSSVMTLGFRGEALSSICAVAHMTVITTTKPPRADKLEYDTSGALSSKSTVSRNKGTTVQVSELFHNLPVRKKELERNHKRQFTKCLLLLQNYALIQNDVKFSVWNVTSNQRKRLILSTGRCQDMPKRILSIFGSSSMRGLSPINLELDLNPYKEMMTRRHVETPSFHHLDYRVKVDGYISKGSFGCGRSAKDRQSVSINKRPIEYQTLLQCCNDVYRSFNNVQYPTVFLDLTLPPELVDVNVTPDKRTVMLHNERYIIEVFRENLINYYDKQELVLPKGDIRQSDQPKTKKRRVASQALNNSYCEDESSDHESTPTSSIPASEGDEIEKSSVLRKDMVASEQNSISPAIESPAEPFPDTEEQDLNSEFIDAANLEKMKSYLNDASNNSSLVKARRKSLGHNFEVPESQSLKETLKKYKKISDQGKDPAEDHDVSLHKSESIVVEIDGEKIDYQAKLSKSGGLAFVCDEATSRSKPCCVDHAKPDFEVSDRDEDEESDSFYALMESQEVNIRSGFDPSSNVSRPAYRSLADHNSTKYFEGERLVASINIGCSYSKIKDCSALLSKRLLVGKHERLFKKNEALQNLEEGERYLTLTIKKSDFEDMTVVGQFNLGFIIVTLQCQDKYDLFIIDQHASDEKYNFEMLQKSTTFKSQRLIAPLPVELSVVDELLVMEHLEVFEKNGFKLIVNENENQGCRIKLTSLPVSKRTLFNVDDFHELVYLVKENAGLNRDSIRCSKIRSMFAMRACRSSIMIGKPLARSTMTKVVRHLSELDKPWNCPHGRPTMRHLMELQDWNSFTGDYEM